MGWPTQLEHWHTPITMDSSTLILICIAVALIAVAIIRRLVFVASFRSIAGPPSLPIFGNALQLNGSPSGKFVFVHLCHTLVYTVQQVHTIIPPRRSVFFFFQNRYRTSRVYWWIHVGLHKICVNLMGSRKFNQPIFCDFKLLNFRDHQLTTIDSLNVWVQWLFM